MKKRMKKGLRFKKLILSITLTLTITAGVFLSWGAVAAGETIARDSKEIQEKIDNAYPGMEIQIEPATYILTSDLTIPKTVILKSEDPDNTVFILHNYHIVIKNSAVTRRMKFTSYISNQSKKGRFS